MKKIRKYGIAVLLVAIAAVVTVANSVGSSETYNGTLADLLIDEADLPEGYVQGVVNNTEPEDGWTFVPAYGVENSLSDEGWMFVPSQGALALSAFTPMEYEGALFWDVNETGDVEGSIIQTVARYSVDDIDAMFDRPGWTFVPATGFEWIEADGDSRGKILAYHEGTGRVSVTMLVTKKDIAVTYTYVTLDEFDPGIIFSLAADLMQEI